MAAPVVSALMNARDYEDYVDPPGMRSELDRGVVVLMPPESRPHGLVASKVERRIGQFAEDHGLGNTTGQSGYLIARDPDTVRAPDAAFLAGPLGESEATWFEGAPTLAVEVIASDQTDAAVARRMADWLEAGSERVWEVRPRTRTVTVHRAGAEPRTLRVGEALSSDDAAFAVEGFMLPLADLFAPLGSAISRPAQA